MPLADVLSLIGGLGSLAAAVSVIYLAVQTRAANRATALAMELARIGAHDRLSDIALDFDRIFIDRPELRKYIHEHEDFRHLVGDELTRVVATAEYVLDFVENALQHATTDLGEVPGQWREYCSALIHRSPVIRNFLVENGSWYDPRILAILREGPPKDRPFVVSRRAGIEVVDLMAGDEREAVRKALEPLYVASFPDSERLDPDQAFGMARRLLVARGAGSTEPLGFATVLPLDASAALLEYVAVAASRRSAGIGRQLVTSVVGLAGEMGIAWTVAEVEPASMSPQAEARIRFYEHMGWSEVPGTTYEMPDLSTVGRRIPMHLYAKPTGSGSARLDADHLVGTLHRTAYPGSNP